MFDVNKFLNTSPPADSDTRKAWKPESFLSFDEVAALRELHWYIEGQLQHLQLDQDAPASAQVVARQRLALIKKLLGFHGTRASQRRGHAA